MTRGRNGDAAKSVGNNTARFFRSVLRFYPNFPENFSLENCIKLLDPDFVKKIKQNLDVGVIERPSLLPEPEPEPELPEPVPAPRPRLNKKACKKRRKAFKPVVVTTPFTTMIYPSKLLKQNEKKVKARSQR